MSLFIDADTPLPRVVLPTPLHDTSVRWAPPDLDTSAVSKHAVRQFRRRVMRLPTLRIRFLIFQVLQLARVESAEVYFTWAGRSIGLVVRNRVAVTVLYGPSDEVLRMMR